MIETIESLTEQFADFAARRAVTVVALGDCAMGRLHPGGIVLLHHMAVGTGFRFVGKVGAALGIIKGIGADAGDTSQTDTGDHEYDVHSRSCDKYVFSLKHKADILATREQ